LNRRLLAPGLTTLVLLAILLMLGFWQLHRLAWKEALLADIAHAEHAPPVPLTDALPSRFARVTASGTLRPGVFALYGDEVRDVGPAPVMGAQLLQVLDRPAHRPVLVDLGWVPADTHTQVTPREGVADVTGFARLAEHAGFLSAPDDPAGRRFYTLDPAAIGRALGVPDLAPFTLVAEGPAPITGPIPAESLPTPPNNHLQYALTWFGLAGALLAVFVAWARKALRSSPPHGA
jgi:surfeit locus 1 family protein